MTIKVLKNGSSTVLYVPKGKKVKHPLTWNNRLFFALTETDIPKTKQERALEEKVRKLNRNVFSRRIEKDKPELKEALERLKLEKLIRYFDAYNLYIGGYGDLDLADIDDMNLDKGEITSVDYRLGKTVGKLNLCSDRYIAIHGNSAIPLTRLI